MNESLPELDRVILSGQRLEALVESIRETDDDGQSALFGALTDNYRAAADEVQAEIDAIIAANTPAMFSNGSVTLDYWMFDSQNVSALAPTLSEITVGGLGYSLPIPSSAADMGYDTFCLNDSVAEPRWTQTWHLLRRQEEADNGGSAANIRARASIFASGSEGIAQIWIGNGALETTAYRTIRFTVEQFLYGPDIWFPIPVLSTEVAREAFGQVWTEERFGASTTFDNDVAFDRRSPAVGSRYSESVIPDAFSPRFRITVTDQSSNPVRQPAIQPRLYSYRSAIHSDVLSALADTASPLYSAAKELDHAESLIDAYVTLGMPLELQESEVLRSALRGTPGLVHPRELGLRSGDVFGLVADMFSNDSPSGWADQDSNVNLIGDVLRDRIDIIEEEIERGLQRPSATPGYVGWMLAELNHLRETAFELAVDDMYSSNDSGMVEVTAAEGLLSNDVMQEFTSVLVDTAYEIDSAYVAPQHGQVTVNADGSFSYQADPGFVGSDSFTYRTEAQINGTTNTAYSAPATVVIKVNDPSCNDADLASPFGELNFFDVSAFLVAFNASDAAADLNDDGEFNFFDVSGFLVAYGDGCP
jgi:hypothetical protein